MTSGQHNGIVQCISDGLSASVHQSEVTIHLDIATITIRLLFEAA